MKTNPSPYRYYIQGTCVHESKDTHAFLSCSFWPGTCHIVAIKFKPQTAWEINSSRSQPAAGILSQEKVIRGEGSWAGSLGKWVFYRPLVCAVYAVPSLEGPALHMCMVFLCTPAWMSPWRTSPWQGRLLPLWHSRRCLPPGTLCPHLFLASGFCLRKLKLNRVSNLFTAVSLEPGRGRGLVNQCLLKEGMHWEDTFKAVLIVSPQSSVFY